MVAINDMNRDELFVWTADLLAEMFELDRDALTPESNLYADLDIDSIDAVDLAVKLKQMTGKRLAPEVFKTIRTIGDVVDALSDLAVSNLAPAGLAEEQPA
ncbi:acyl carrier protein [Massilia sp. IC2-278]|uniref:acyl carrier protein n=1 Tax=Massilia sp. IC2-278 TaxID=2887200 RepID=UPI001E5759EC|nr:acyl carrier protein [Massilia sp. IC2-278]MCC2960391.1 acyl carrier protein [Massilia sp. IC2-278]